MPNLFHKKAMEHLAQKSIDAAHVAKVRQMAEKALGRDDFPDAWALERERDFGPEYFDVLAELLEALDEEED